MIDGQDAVEAGYGFAGIVGVSPRGFTLRQLWWMAEGELKARRRSNLEVATLVWSLSEIDCEDYLHFGQMTGTGSGGPVQIPPELRGRLDEEIARIRRENPNLPGIKTMGEKG